MNCIECYIGSSPQSFNLNIPETISAQKFKLGDVKFLTSAMPVALLVAVADHKDIDGKALIVSLKKIAKHCLATGRKANFILNPKQDTPRVKQMIEQEIIKKGISNQITLL